ncbi:MAG: hypothetical protein COA83_09920 [Methylophaga sp.]|nr:MAG: hypothetical protein COA83_09920 [Methylophaga sp.]
MRITAAMLAIISGWYIFQRLTAGNAYASALQQPTTFLGFDIPDFNRGDTMPELRYFTAAEFGEWWPLMSTDFLTKLDEFRHRLGVPVRISPATGSLGRESGLDTSQHNVDMWGEVRAGDVMFIGVDLETAYKVAKEVGFTGIGAYPDWKPTQGMHLDVRQAPLALWSGILESGKQVYKSIQQAFV